MNRERERGNKLNGHNIPKWLGVHASAPKEWHPGNIPAPAKSQQKPLVAWFVITQSSLIVVDKSCPIRRHGAQAGEVLLVGAFLSLTLQHMVHQ